LPTKITEFSHINNKGEARMVDVGEKELTERIATASAEVLMSESCYALLKAGHIKKGDVLSVARIAGIQAAKQTAHLIPLCHPLMLTHIEIEFDFNDANCLLEITSTCSLKGKTGVEMEALTAVSVAALTVYDMCKAVDKGMQINHISLLKKSGGKSGDWQKEKKKTTKKQTEKSTKKGTKK
jgi:cyclic pyranopterin monophosphate synthase